MQLSVICSRVFFQTLFLSPSLLLLLLLYAHITCIGKACEKIVYQTRRMMHSKKKPTRKIENAQNANLFSTKYLSPRPITDDTPFIDIVILNQCSSLDGFRLLDLCCVCILCVCMCTVLLCPPVACCRCCYCVLRPIIGSSYAVWYVCLELLLPFCICDVCNPQLCRMSALAKTHSFELR